MWHAGYTFYKGIEHLIPNHYLDTQRLSGIRFYPSTKNKIVSNPDEILKIEEEITQLLKNSIQSLQKRNPLPLHFQRVMTQEF